MKRFWWVHGCWGALSCTILLHISEICPLFDHSDDGGKTAPETLVSINDPIRRGNPAFCYIINTSHESLNKYNSFSFHCDSCTYLCFSSTKININTCPLLIQRYPCENLQEKCRRITSMYKHSLNKATVTCSKLQALLDLDISLSYGSPLSCVNELP